MNTINNIKKSSGVIAATLLNNEFLAVRFLLYGHTYPVINWQVKNFLEITVNKFANGFPVLFSPTTPKTSTNVWSGLIFYRRERK